MYGCIIIILGLNAFDEVGSFVPAPVTHGLKNDARHSLRSWLDPASAYVHTHSLGLLTSRSPGKAEGGGGGKAEGERQDGGEEEEHEIKATRGEASNRRVTIGKGGGNAGRKRTQQETKRAKEEDKQEGVRRRGEEEHRGMRSSKLRTRIRRKKTKRQGRGKAEAGQQNR